MRRRVCKGVMAVLLCMSMLLAGCGKEAEETKGRDETIVSEDETSDDALEETEEDAEDGTETAEDGTEDAEDGAGTAENGAGTTEDAKDDDETISSGENETAEGSEAEEDDNLHVKVSPKPGTESLGGEEEPAESQSPKTTPKPGTVSSSDFKTCEVAFPSTSGALHVEGTQLVDSNGNAVQLKGISTHGISWFPGYVNEECFKQLRTEWNVDVIRLAMYTADYNGYCSGGNQEELKKLVHEGVKYATNQDMYVIIDWHILSDNNPNTYIEESKKFFAEMSATYADYNNVIYEICNEPNGGIGWSEIKSYAETIIPVIREKDADAIILVGTPNWSQYVDQAAADPITGYDNIMYTLHFYAATHTDSLRSTMVAAIQNGLPVFVSEYGICDASGNGAIDEKQASQWVSTMNAYGVSYVAWNLSNKNETSSIISSSCSKTSGFTESDLSASGMWLYKILTGNAGTMASGEPAQSSSNSGGNNAGGSDGNNGGSSAGGSDSSDGNSTDGNSGSGSSDGSNGGSSAGGSTTPTGTTTLTDGDITYTAELKNSWESGSDVFYQYELVLKNTSGKDCTGWAIDVTFSDTITFSDGWCGKYTVEGNVLHITPAEYNGNIPAGESIKDIGFIISGSKNLEVQ